MTYIIYTLSHPDTEEVKYVGVTSNLRARAIGHHADTYYGQKGKWNREIRLSGKKIKIDIVDSCEDSLRARYLEQEWIWTFRSWGFDLFNKAISYNIIKPHPVTSVRLGDRKDIINLIAERDGCTPHNVILTAVDLYIEARKIKP